MLMLSSRLPRYALHMARKSTILGLTGWLPFQGRERLEQTLEALYDLHVREFRTVFSWADWEREGGEAWFNTVAKSLGEVPRLRVLPIFTATPQKRSMKDSRGARKSSYPPEELSSYAAFVRTMIDRYGDLFDTVELWREPNSRTHWEWKLDEDGARFAVMAMEAAKSARSLKKKIALGALSPLDLTYLSRMDAWGLLAHIDAVSFLYSPSTREREGYALADEVRALRALIRGLGHTSEVWFCGTGTSARADNGSDESAHEARQMEHFDDIRGLSVDRVYWSALHDTKDGTATGYGLLRVDGTKNRCMSIGNALANVSSSEPSRGRPARSVRRGRACR